ncbi:MAG: RidA family protein [Actinomycetota bacterium]|nr:RidA family protein [Actinomycetota bacterium]
MGNEFIDASRHLGKTPGYSYAARAVGQTTVYTAGAVPLDTDGNVIGIGDLEEQTRVVIANLLSALGSAGVGPADVVKTTIYVVGNQREDLSRAWRVFASSDLVHAPSTLLGVSVLGYDDQLVEIEAIAATD